MMAANVLLLLLTLNENSMQLAYSFCSIDVVEKLHDSSMRLACGAAVHDNDTQLL